MESNASGIIITGMVFLPHQLDNSEVTPQDIVTVSFNGVLNEVIPRHFNFCRSQVFHKLTFGQLTKILTYIRYVCENGIRGILKFVRVIQVNEILNEGIEVSANFNVMLSKTEEFSNGGKGTRVTTTDPMNVQLFRVSFIVNVGIMDTKRPFLKSALDFFHNCFIIIDSGIRIYNTGKNPFLISHKTNRLYI